MSLVESKSSETTKTRDKNMKPANEQLPASLAAAAAAAAIIERKKKESEMSRLERDCRDTIFPPQKRTDIKRKPDR